MKIMAGNTNSKGRLSTVDLLAPTCSILLLCNNKTFLTFYAKRDNLVWRPTVASLPLQLVIPDKDVKNG